VREAEHFEARLWRLGVFAPLTSDPPASRVRRWLLVRCGKRCALRWLAWVERRDLHRLMSLVTLDSKSSGREWALEGRVKAVPPGRSQSAARRRGPHVL
jgi:hypothetical protein